MAVNYGWEEEVFVSQETTYGTEPTVSGGDAIKHLSCDITFTHERHDRVDKSPTRSLLERISGRKSAEWTITKYLIPSGDPDTAPDEDLLLTGLLGNSSASVTSVDANAYVKYTLTPEPSTSFTLFRYAGSLLQKVGGCVVNEATFTFPQGDFITVEYRGVGKEVVRASSSGKPAATTAGSPIYGVRGSFSINGTTYQITEATITVANNVELRNDVYGSDAAVGYRYTGKREVSGEFTMYLTTGWTTLYDLAAGFNNASLTIIAGNSTGNRFKIYIPYVEWEIPAVEIPETGEGTLRIPFRARGSSGEDEIVITHY
jgi:hypothetical protein